MSNFTLLMGVKLGLIFLEITLEVSRALNIFVPFDPEIFLLKTFPTKLENQTNTYAQKCLLPLYLGSEKVSSTYIFNNRRMVKI